MQTFYLGAHRYNWVCDGLTDQPQFISDRTLRRRITPFKPAVTPYAVDSGTFTEGMKSRHMDADPIAYAARGRRYAAELGMMDFICQQDRMCEPEMLAHTRFSVNLSQIFSLNNFIALRDAAPELPWAPTIQGWTLGEYYDHLDMYRRAGIDLTQFPTVCVGSVCRRENPVKASLILRAMAREGLRVHAFGVKAEVLELCADAIQSSDSMAWSTHMRAERNAARKKGLPFEHFDPNSLDCALAWVDNTITPARARGGCETLQVAA